MGLDRNDRLFWVLLCLFTLGAGIDASKLFMFEIPQDVRTTDIITITLAFLMAGDIACFAYSLWPMKTVLIFEHILRKGKDSLTAALTVTYIGEGVLLGTEGKLGIEYGLPPNPS